MTIRKRIFAAAAALALSATSSFAAGPPGGGHSGGGHSGGGHSGGGHPGGYSGGHSYSGGHYGGYSGGGIALGLGIGLGLGSGFGGGYYGGGYGGSIYRPSYYGNGGYSGGGYYGNAVQPNYSPNYSIAPQTAYTYPNVVNDPSLNPSIIPQNPQANATIPLGVATGLKITDLYEGTAKVAGLRKGDIILKVDGTRTQSFEELRATLSTGKDSVVVEFIDGTSGETDKRTIPVDGTKIGVSVAETPIAK